MLLYNTYLLTRFIPNHMLNIRRSSLAALSLLIVLVACNRSTVIKNSITFHKDIMTVAVYEKIDGKVRKDYSRVVNVAGMPKDEKNALGKQILDSLKALPDN